MIKIVYKKLTVLLQVYPFINTGINKCDVACLSQVLVVTCHLSNFIRKMKFLYILTFYQFSQIMLKEAIFQK